MVRLPDIISREVDPNKIALLTCGSIYAGDAPNIIRNKATLKVNIRAYRPKVLDKAIQAFKQIILAKCDASSVTQKSEIKQIESVPPLTCDLDIVRLLTEKFTAFFKTETDEIKVDIKSDDFSILAPKGGPYAYWNFGSTDHDTWEKVQKEGILNELPGNHSALYAPIIGLTLKTGAEAIAIAALTLLVHEDTVVRRRRSGLEPGC